MIEKVSGAPSPSSIASNTDVWLDRKAAAAALTKAGYRTAASSLATMATRGGGPPFHRFGRTPLYRPRDLLEWAQSRLSPVVRSTSELGIGRLSGGER
jgi:hypothetical protein